MTQNTEQEVFHVVSQLTQQELFRQSVSAEWFRQELITRTAWAAAFSNPELRGLPMQADLATVEEDGHVLHWIVTLSSGGKVRACRKWPLTVLEATALAVSRQLNPWLGVSKVLYWVGVENDPRPSSPVEGIEFELNDECCTVLIPEVTTRSTKKSTRRVAPNSSFPVEAVVELSEEAYQELMSGVEDERYSDRELAWIGEVAIEYLQDEGVMVYVVASLTRLAAPEATATLCPIQPEELVNVFHADRPVVFVHTHVVSDQWAAKSTEDGCLACSHDDLVCFRRLPVGSVGVIAASRPPLCVRAYGWPVHAGELVELAATVTVDCDSRGG